ncbi:MAG TPA: serine/threonine-protein kinase [Burkholderiales bacterium]|nr:serine/threonine-protein kinase [Burkholderiales bacterium]
MTALGKVGKYELRHQIGRGAMGVVYEAFDTVIERPVALKMLRTDLYAPEQLADVRARFKREAHSAGRLSHPNIVTIFDYGEHEGAPYIAMDLMTGEELARSLESGARMALPQVVRVMEQLLAALAYAHEKGVVHRDMKPSNVFVLRDATIKVVDFGLARIEASNLTETGTLLGTPAYMSPEQFLGLPADARSDLFSVGVMLYQMLTGDRPFTGSPSTIMQKVLRQDPVEPSVLNPTLSAAWDDLVKRALAKKPDHRLQSARQFAEYVRLVSEGKPLPGTPPSADATVVIDATVRIAPPKQPARSKLPVIALASAAVVALVAGGIALFYKPAERPPAASTVPLEKAAPPAPVAAVQAPEKPAPKPKPKAVEKKPAKLAAPPPAPVAEAKIAPPPRPVIAKVESGKVVSLDRSWGFLVVESADTGVKVGDRLYANLADGRRVAIVVRRISGNLVSAVPEGQKISDDMLGASVTSK